MMDRFQNLLSIPTRAATAWSKQGGQFLVGRGVIVFYRDLQIPERDRLTERVHNNPRLRTLRIVAFEKTSVKHNTRCELSFFDRVPVKRTFTTQQSRAAEELSARFQDARNFRIIGVDALSFSRSAIRKTAMRKTEVDPESRIFRL